MPLPIFLLSSLSSRFLSDQSIPELACVLSQTCYGPSSHHFYDLMDSSDVMFFEIVSNGQ